jgi:hypothetical protein
MQTFISQHESLEYDIRDPSILIRNTSVFQQYHFVFSDLFACDMYEHPQDGSYPIKHTLCYMCEENFVIVWNALFALMPLRIFEQWMISIFEYRDPLFQQHERKCSRGLSCTYTRFSNGDGFEVSVAGRLTVFLGRKPTYLQILLSSQHLDTFYKCVVTKVKKQALDAMKRSQDIISFINS